MKRPAYELVTGLLTDTPQAQPVEDALYRLAWLADNFHYSSYEQAQQIMRDALPDLARHTGPGEKR